MAHRPVDSDTQRLLLYCAFDGGAAFAAAVMLALLRATLIPSDWLAVLVIVIAIFVVTLIEAARLIMHGRVWTGIVVIAGCTWGTLLTITFLVPYTLVIIPLAALLPALLAIPHLDRRGIQAMFGGAVLVVALLSLLGRLHDGVGLEAMTPSVARAAAQMIFVPCIVGLAAYISYKNMGTLRSRSEGLRASRARLVASADLERRRIEQDLHDGAQQYLVAAAMQVKVAQRAAGHPSTAVAPLLEEAGDIIQDAVTELRDLAHGIYPPELADQGLPAALRAAARTSPLPVTIGSHGVGRYSPQIETNLYFTCLEALQNAAKHAGPHATVAIALDGSHGLTATITDTGAGADPRTLLDGHGITNMTDRIGAIGGTLSVTTSPGHGVHINAHIPPTSTRSASLRNLRTDELVPGGAGFGDSADSPHERGERHDASNINERRRR